MYTCWDGPAGSHSAEESVNRADQLSALEQGDNPMP